MSQVDDINGMINDALGVANANTNQANIVALAANAALFKQLAVNIDAYLTTQAVVVTPPVVTPPVITPPTSITPWLKSFRISKAAHAYNPKEQGCIDGQNVGSLKDFAGGKDLPYIGKPVQALSGSGGCKYYTGGGLLGQNAENEVYRLALSDKPYPSEQWFLFYKPNYFLAESAIKFQGNLTYLGDLFAGEIRIDSDGSRDSKGNPIVPNDWLIDNTGFPVEQYFTLRLVHTLTPGAAKANVDVYINNIKIPVTQQKAYWIAQSLVIGFNSETNGEYIGILEYLFFNGQLSPADATTIQSEITAAYPQPNAPIAKNLNYTVVNGNRTPIYNWFSPLGLKEDVSKRQIRWVNMPQGSPTTATYLTQYDNQWTVPNNFLGRAEVTIFDTAGNRSILPATAAWNSL